jgi:hypothetical protein
MSDVVLYIIIPTASPLLYCFCLIHFVLKRRVVVYAFFDFSLWQILVYISI